MKELREVLMDIRKEIRCADMYAKEAKKHKHEYPELSAVYHRIATDKMVHAEMLNRQAHDIAMKHHAEDVWDVEDYMTNHDMEEVKKCLDSYRD